jgi:hypothetical protein
MMSVVEVHTAIPMSDAEQRIRQQDLEQPLIPRSDNNAIDDDEEENVHTCWLSNVMTTWTFINGFWLGFLIQTISLGSTAVLAIKWGKPTSWTSKQDEFYYALFFVLSQSWWLLFPIICFAIDGGLAANGKSVFERFFYPHADASPREIFLGGVRFHVGIVFGCFLVWSLIDLYFGASVTVFATLIASFFACLGLCYGMVVIHDRYISEQRELENEESESEESP